MFFASQVFDKSASEIGCGGRDSKAADAAVAAAEEEEKRQDELLKQLMDDSNLVSSRFWFCLLCPAENVESSASSTPFEINTSRN